MLNNNHEFPDSTGYSARNLKYMAKFAHLYPDEQIVQEVLAQIPWYHNVTLMDKVREEHVALWYAQESARNGWSRNVLVHQIENKSNKNPHGGIKWNSTKKPKSASSVP